MTGLLEWVDAGDCCDGGVYGMSDRRRSDARIEIQTRQRIKGVCGEVTRRNVQCATPR